MAANSNLHSAKDKKNDEFYTQLADIERELIHYKEHFNGKTILCNCDDPRISNFFKYFALNFQEFGLKRIISTCYKNQNVDLFTQNDCEKAVWLDYYGNPNDPTNTDFSTVEVKELRGDGDFRSAECIELLKQADIVATNPPFSLFKEYVAQLIENKKQFIIIGSMNAISYKDIFPLIKENKMWLGYGFKGGNAYFEIGKNNDKQYAQGVLNQETKIVHFRNCCWFTNIDIKKRHEELVLYKAYSENDFPKYDNYDAIEVSKTADIPMDYDGVMGVPITFLDKYNPDQFEILGMESSAGYDPNIVGIPRLKEGDARPCINGKTTYARIFIKRKK